MQQLVAIQLADQRARAVVIRDIGGILREDIAYDLIDGVVALIFQRGINGRQDVADLSVLLLGNIKLSGKFFHWESPSFPYSQYSNADPKSKGSAVNCNQIVIFPYGMLNEAPRRTRFQARQEWTEHPHLPLHR